MVKCLRLSSVCFLSHGHLSRKSSIIFNNLSKAAFFSSIFCRFKHIFIGTFFFSFLFAGAQKNGLLSNKKWYLKAAVNYGFIMQHRATIGHLITSYVPMAEIRSEEHT